MGELRNSILALDDDSSFLEELKFSLNALYEITDVQSVEAAAQAIFQSEPDLILLDMNLPDISGIEFLKFLRQRRNDTAVIMLTADGNPASVVEAMQNGATDYVVKGTPNFFPTLKNRITLALKINQFKKQNIKLNSKITEYASKYEILGISTAAIQLKNEIQKYKGASASVLISGENGTGKELVARNLNFQEDSPDRPFVAVNCGAIPQNLFESELFGHAKGSFTGAMADQIGKFVAADGGDLFLDEIGELPLEMQVKLLRVLQEKVVTPVGSVRPIPVQVRVIAATNRNLEDLVREKKFRQDLYFRINQIQIQLPPLRERKSDIRFLACSFAEKYHPGVSFTEEAIEKIELHRWPGNIRELSNTVERACILARAHRNSIIRVEDLSLSNLEVDEESTRVPARLFPQSAQEISDESYKKCFDWIENEYFNRGLELLDGNRPEFINKVGISKSYFYNRKKDFSENHLK